MASPLGVCKLVAGLWHLRAALCNLSGVPGVHVIEAAGVTRTTVGAVRPVHAGLSPRYIGIAAVIDNEIGRRAEHAPQSDHAEFQRLGEWLRSAVTVFRAERHGVGAAFQLAREVIDAQLFERLTLHGRREDQ